MAFRHRCPNADRSGCSRCPAGDGRPGKGPARCPGCHGSLVVEEGRYVVIRWRQDGRYTWENRACAYQSQARADAKADEMNAREGYRAAGFVVRFLAEGDPA